jgi:inorganic phosphate transporter, PiT family
VAADLALVVALAYALTNGFHDAANAIATLVATRGATPLQAVLLASVCNLLGPLLLGAAVADTVAGVVQLTGAAAIAVVGAAMSAAVVWNLLTWWRDLPSSSGHALVGGLVGAALVDGGASAILWGGFDGIRPVGVLGILGWLLITPVLAALAGAAVEGVLRAGTRRATRSLRGPVRAGQWFASGLLALSHGGNDAQKAVGLMAVVLVGAGRQSSLATPTWTLLAAGAALTFGTMFGGWGIVRTIGRRIFPIRPLDGLAAQSSSTAVILSASFLGAPVSTTQVVSSSVVGVGVGRGRWRRVHWPVVREILLAWVTTIPATAVLGALFLPLWRWFS